MNGQANIGERALQTQKQQKHTETKQKQSPKHSEKTYKTPYKNRASTLRDTHLDTPEQASPSLTLYIPEQAPHSLTLDTHDGGTRRKVAC